MAKLALKANPTFEVKVGIPTHGGEPVEVSFTFKHKTRTQYDAFAKEFSEREVKSSEDSIAADVDYIMAICCGWELDDEFNAANVRELVENRVAVSAALSAAYTQTLMQVKLGN